MITVERIQKIYTIRKVFQDCWEATTDDGSGAFENFIPNCRDPRKYFLGVYKDNSLICMVMLFKTTHTLAECHLIVCKEFRGKNLTQHYQKVREYLLENTSIKNLITLLPESRKYIINYSLKHGWKEKCKIRNAFQKNGVIEDCVLLELEL